MLLASEVLWFMVVRLARISRDDKMMISWMCNVSLKDDRSLDELRDRMGILDITVVPRKNILKWFGKPASACKHVVVESKREQGRPKKYGPN